MLSIYYLLHLPHHKREFLSFLYVASTMRTFAWSMLSSFMPILILQMMQKQGETYIYSLLVVILVFIALHVVAIITSFLCSFVTSRWGLKFAFLIAEFLVSIFFMLMPFCNSVVTLIANFMLLGVAGVFWWQTYITYFSEMGKVKEYGKEVGLAEFFGIMTGIIGPIIGSLIIRSYGSSVLYGISALVVVGSMFVIAFMEDLEKLDSVTIKDVIYEMVHRKRDCIAFIGIGADELLYTVVWPIFLFTILKNLLDLGIFTSTVVLVTAVVAYFAGKMSDIVNKNFLARIGSGVVMVSWISKAFVLVPGLIFVLDSIQRIFMNFLYIPVKTVALIHASQDNRMRYMNFREVSIRIGNVVALLIFFVIIYLGLPFWYIFIFGAIFALFPVVVQKR
ncbi:MAG: MFS transporter [Candidatus Roizmanbacteria bacterium]